MKGNIYKNIWTVQAGLEGLKTTKVHNQVGRKEEADLGSVGEEEVCNSNVIKNA